MDLDGELKMTCHQVSGSILYAAIVVTRPNGRQMVNLLSCVQDLAYGCAGECSLRSPWSAPLIPARGHGLPVTSS